MYLRHVVREALLTAPHPELGGPGHQPPVHTRTESSEAVSGDGSRTPMPATPKKSWEDIIVSLVSQAVATVQPRLNEGDRMDIREYVKVKVVPGGDVSECEYVEGVVCRKNLAHKNMPSSFAEPRILVLRDGLEYENATAAKLSSLETLHEQEYAYTSILVSKILALSPDLVLVGGNVSAQARTMLLADGKSVVMRVKPSVLARVSRLTGALILPSSNHVDKVSADDALGTCGQFFVRHVQVPNGDGVGKPRHGVRDRQALFVLDGCPPELGATIVLRGGDKALLKQIKSVVRWALFVGANLRLEASFLFDEGADVPSRSLRAWADPPTVPMSPALAASRKLHGQTGATDTGGGVAVASPGGRGEGVAELDYGLLGFDRMLPSSPDVVYPIQESTKRSLCASLMMSVGLSPGSSTEAALARGPHVPAVVASFSQQNILLGTCRIHNNRQCAPPSLTRVRFYSAHDMSLGQFLEERCFIDEDAECSSCRKPMVNHRQSFQHNRGRVEVEIMVTRQPLPTEHPTAATAGHRGRARSKSDPAARNGAGAEEVKTDSAAAATDSADADDAERSPSPAPSPPKLPDWVCAVCARRNDGHVTSCVACGRSERLVVPSGVDLEALTPRSALEAARLEAARTKQSTSVSVTSSAGATGTSSIAEEGAGGDAEGRVRFFPEAARRRFDDIVAGRLVRLGDTPEQDETTRSSTTRSRSATTGPAGADDESDSLEPIITYSWCVKCKRTVTPVVRLSRQTWAFSFSKTLELAFYNHTVICRTEGCGHCPHTDHVRYYGRGRHLAAFHYYPIEPRTVVHTTHLPADRSWVRQHYKEELGTLQRLGQAACEWLLAKIRTADEQTRSLVGEAAMGSRGEALKLLRRDAEDVRAWIDTVASQGEPERLQLPTPRSSVATRAATRTTGDAALVRDGDSGAADAQHTAAPAASAAPIGGPASDDVNATDGQGAVQSTPAAVGLTEALSSGNDSVELLVLTWYRRELVKRIRSLDEQLIAVMQFTLGQSDAPDTAAAVAAAAASGLASGGGAPDPRRRAMSRVPSRRRPLPAEWVAAGADDAPAGDGGSAKSASDGDDEPTLDASASDEEAPATVAFSAAEDSEAAGSDAAPAAAHSAAGATSTSPSPLEPESVIVATAHGASSTASAASGAAGGAGEPREDGDARADAAAVAEAAEQPARPDWLRSLVETGDDYPETFGELLHGHPSLPPGRGEVAVLVFDDAPVSVVAYALASPLYWEQFKSDVAHATRAARRATRHSRTESRLRDIATIRGASSAALSEATSPVDSSTSAAQSAATLAGSAEEPAPGPAGTPVDSSSKSEGGEPAAAAVPPEEVDAGTRLVGTESLRVQPPPMRPRVATEGGRAGMLLEGEDADTPVDGSDDVTSARALGLAAAAQASEVDAAGRRATAMQAAEDTPRSDASGASSVPGARTLPRQKSHSVLVSVLASATDRSVTTATSLVSMPDSPRSAGSRSQRAAAASHARTDTGASGNSAAADRARRVSRAAALLAGVDPAEEATGESDASDSDAASAADAHASPEPAADGLRDSALSPLSIGGSDAEFGAVGVGSPPSPRAGAAGGAGGAALDDDAAAAELTPADILLSEVKSDIKLVFRDLSPESSCTFTCTVFRAIHFAALRAVYCDSEWGYVQSLAFARQWAATGGKSGVDFFRTQDGRFVVKQVTRTEFVMFLDAAFEYFKHMHKAFFQRFDTMLVKILGAYKVVTAPRNAGVRSRTTRYLIVMENLFYGRNIPARLTFDLKGKSRSQKAQAEGADDTVLLDADLLKYTHGHPLALSESAKRRLNWSVLHDTELLAQIKVVDYSLLVGLDPKTGDLLIGVIDYLRRYDMLKKIEFGGTYGLAATAQFLCLTGARARVGDVALLRLQSSSPPTWAASPSPPSCSPSATKCGYATPWKHTLLPYRRSSRTSRCDTRGAARAWALYTRWTSAGAWPSMAAACFAPSATNATLISLKASTWRGCFSPLDFAWPRAPLM